MATPVSWFSCMHLYVLDLSGAPNDFLNAYVIQMLQILAMDGNPAGVPLWQHGHLCLGRWMPLWPRETGLHHSNQIRASDVMLGISSRSQSHGGRLPCVSWNSCRRMQHQSINSQSRFFSEASTLEYGSSRLASSVQLSIMDTTFFRPCFSPRIEGAMISKWHQQGSSDG